MYFYTSVLFFFTSSFSHFSLRSLYEICHCHWCFPYSFALISFCENIAKSEHVLYVAYFTNSQHLELKSLIQCVLSISVPLTKGRCLKYHTFRKKWQSREQMFNDRLSKQAKLIKKKLDTEIQKIWTFW